MRLLSVLPRIGILAMLLTAVVPPAPAPAQVSIGLSVNIGPPALPVYVQPPCPQPNLIWTPGYWAYGPYGYYWVPGAWVPAPYPGYLWTPGYWGYAGGVYGWHAGYWGTHVGFYGGVNYGGGYFGVGFVGGAWAGNVFRYNTAVVNVNTTVIHNTYVNKTVINNNYYTNSRASFNGPGGVNRQPLPEEAQYSHETHIPPTSIQRQHVQVAQQNRNYLASVNHGRPATAAVDQPLTKANRPADFAPVHEQDKVNAQNANNYRATHPEYNENHPPPGHSYRDTHPEYNEKHPVNYDNQKPSAHHNNQNMNGANHPNQNHPAEAKPPHENGEAHPENKPEKPPRG